MKLMIVDDHDIFRQSLALLLAQEAQLEVLAHFSRLSELLDHSDAARVDCILLDFHLPGEDPLAAIRQLRGRWPQAFLVFLTGTRSPAILQRIIESEVNGVLHKSDDAQHIVQMLQQLDWKKQVVSPTILTEIKSVDFGLTTKEFDVLALLTKGQTPAQIADNLCLSKRTVEKHKENMMRKTNAHNLAQLIDLGHRLISPE